MKVQVHNDIVPLSIQSLAMCFVSIAMNFFKAIDNVDAVFVTPLLHALQLVAVIIGICAGLAALSSDFKTQSDQLIKRFFNLFK